METTAKDESAKLNVIKLNPKARLCKDVGFAANTNRPFRNGMEDGVTWPVHE